jgi:hypothetical protein
VHTAYGDESADETKQRVFSVAGLFGSEADWRDLYGKWQARTGGKIFHASDCDTNHGDFKTGTDKENKKLYADLSKIIGSSKLIGAAAAISLPDYRELLAARIDENPYYVCFYSVIGALASDSAVCIPRDSIKFVFDRNSEIEFNAAQLYDHFIRNDKDADTAYKRYMHDEIAFATRETIGIQAADLLAREAMKHMDNLYGPVRRPIRLAYQALRRNKGIRVRLYNRGWCEHLVRFVRDEGGFHDHEEYAQWLKQRGLDGDTLARRLRFQAERRGNEEG